MIRADEDNMELSGDMLTLLTEVTAVIRSLIKMYSREEIMASLMSAIYTLPENEEDAIDIQKGVRDFQNDTKIALRLMEHVGLAKGRTMKEKSEAIKEENLEKLKQLKGDLKKLLQEFADETGANLEIEDDEEEEDE